MNKQTDTHPQTLLKTIPHLQRYHCTCGKTAHHVYINSESHFFNAKWGGIYRRNSGGIYRRESHFSTVNAAVFTAAVAPCIM